MLAHKALSCLHEGGQAQALELSEATAQRLSTACVCSLARLARCMLVGLRGTPYAPAMQNYVMNECASGFHFRA